MLNLLEAMAAVESGGKPKARSTRNNNPGNINWGPPQHGFSGGFAQRHGASRIEIIPPGYSSTPRFAYWEDIGKSDGSVPNTGWGAMKALLQLPGTFIQVPATDTVPAHRKLDEGYAGATVREMLNKYAPAGDGNIVSAYEARVCKLAGCTPATIIDTLINSL